MDNRTLALEFYRLNLHGTGWKIESGDFASAITMLNSYVKDLAKVRDFTNANIFKGHLAKVKAFQKESLKKAA